MKAVDLFKAVAEETRLRLLNLTREYELNVRELTAILAMGQSRISRHLKILADQGLIRARRDGLWVFYRAAEEGPGARFTGALSYLLQGNPVLEEDLRRAQEHRERSRRETARFFDSLAGEWERLRHDIIGPVDLAERIASRLPACDTAADLGCGTGALLALLSRNAQRVIGVDGSAKMLERARRAAATLGPRVQLRLGDLEQLPMVDAEADCAVINLVLHHLARPLEGLLEARRVLKRGGRLIVVELARHGEEELRTRYGDRWLGFDPEEMASWMEKAGFLPSRRERFSLKRGLTAMLYEAEARPPAEPAGGGAGPGQRQSQPMERGEIR